MNTMTIEQTQAEASLQITGIHWKPNRDTLVVLASYALVVAALWMAFQVFTLEQVALNFITFGPVTLALLGVGVPVLYTVFARRRSLADLGITRRNLWASLALGILLGADTYRNTIAHEQVAWTGTLVAVATMTLAVGLFEAVFFRGWLQLRFEAAFGMVPGLVLAALCYSLYHVGYGMTLDEMTFLFGYGLVFGGLFRLTRNIVLLWPFYTPVGGLYENISSGLSMPFEATYGFVLTLVLMLVLIVAGAVWHTRHPERTLVGAAPRHATQGV
jgi:hypothetical protein